MSFINAKKQANHNDYDKTNNGGVVIQSPSGNTPSGKVNEKFSEEPGEVKNGGFNRPVKPSTY